MQRGLLTGISLGVAMTIFALQNSVKVPVRFLWSKFEDVPLALIVLIAILTGVLITVIFAFIDQQKLKARIKRLQTKIKALEGNTADETIRTESDDSFKEDDTIIEREHGHKFFDD